MYLPGKNGKTWHLGTSKDRAGRVIGIAVEGELTRGNGMTSFSYVMFEARRVEVVTAHKRATAKAETEAMAALKIAVQAKIDEPEAAPVTLDPMRPAIVRLVAGGGEAPVCCPIDDLPLADAVAALPALGYALEKNDEPGHRQLREDLQHRPTFAGLCGPMWGGTDEATGLPILRYETWAAYERLSA